MMGLVDRARVFTEASNGNYTVVAKSELRCRLEHVRGGQSQEARADLASIRHLVWQGDYEMPSDCEIQLLNKAGNPEGSRWNPIDDTFGFLRGAGNTKKFRICDVVEVRS